MLNDVVDVEINDKFSSEYSYKQIVERLLKICRLARKYQKIRDFNVRMNMNKELDELYGKPGAIASKTRQG